MQPDSRLGAWHVVGLCFNSRLDFSCVCSFRQISSARLISMRCNNVEDGGLLVSIRPKLLYLGFFIL